MKRILYTLIFIALPVAIAAQFRQDSISNDSIEPFSLRSSATTSSFIAEMPVIIPKTPEVRGLERYGEYPVSQYTGTMSVNIPLHTIKINGFEFPVSLNYHATGIQVTQEATWIGLGWNLLAGGCITTIPVGKIDNEYYGSYWSSKKDWDKLIAYATKDLSYRPALPEYAPIRFQDDAWNPYSGQLKPYEEINVNNEIFAESSCGRGEQDIYNVMFLGHSFKFSIHLLTNEIVYHGEKGDYKVKYNVTGREIKWMITDNSGYTYHFIDFETYTPHDPFFQRNVSTWYLSKVFYEGKEIVKFNYIKKYVKYMPNISDRITFITMPSNPTNLSVELNRSVTENHHTTQYLSSIVSPFDSIAFLTKDRIDVRGGLGLDEIRIIERETGSIVKKYKFLHDYFTGVDTAAEQTNHDYVKKRLKLTELREYNGNTSKSHFFNYVEEIPLPYKTSFAQDFWGYYNGRTDNLLAGEWSDQDPFKFSTFNSVISSEYRGLYAGSRTLIPSPYILFNEMTPNFKKNCLKKGFNAANRSPRKDYMTAGILKSVVYPTGGKSVFEFEPHTFSNRKYPSMNTVNFLSVQSVYVANNNSGYWHNNEEFEVTEEAINAKIEMEISGTDISKLKSISSVKLILNINTSDQTEYLFSFDVNNDPAICQQNSNYIKRCIELDSLPEGIHKLSAEFIPNSIPIQETHSSEYMVTARVTYNVEDIPNIPEDNIGNGVRIKNITNYSDETTIASIKNYRYTSTENGSSGKLIYPLRFSNDSKPKVRLSGGFLHTEIHSDISGSNIYNYSAVNCQNSVGYERVEEVYNSLNTNDNNGTVIYSFVNNPSESIFDDLFFPFNIDYTKNDNIFYNGNLLSKILLSSSKDTLKVERYNYSIDDFESKFTNLLIVNNRLFHTECSGRISVENGPVGDIYNVFVILYSFINYKNNLIAKEETGYYGNNKITQKTTFEYDENHYSLKKSVLHLENETRETEYKYPYDFNTAEPYKSMVSENILSMPIEETMSKNNQFLEKRITSYKQWGEKQFYPEVIRLQKNGQATPEDRIRFHNYDIYGNPLYITKDNNTKVVYLWGYKGQYPVAEIANVAYSDVIGVIGQNSVNYIREKSSEDATVKTLLSTLRNGLPNALVTTYTYRPLVGIKTMTNPQGVKVTYEYDSFNRLQCIKDDSGKIIENYDYHYQNQ